MKKFGIKFKSKDDTNMIYISYLTANEFEIFINKKGYKVIGNTIYPKGLKSIESIHFKQSTDFFANGAYELIYYNMPSEKR